MAEMTIRLRCDPVTGKKDIIVSLGADEDALAHEHEQMHRALVDKLILNGLVKAGEIGQVIVEREPEGKQAAVRVKTEPERERKSVSEGQ
jgi:hypothetical protein